MNSDLSLTLTACLLFLLLSSNYACKLMHKVAKLSDDMTTVALTVVFGFAFMAFLRFV